MQVQDNERTVSQLDNEEQTLQQTVQRPVLCQRRWEADRPSAGTDGLWDRRLPGSGRKHSERAHVRHLAWSLQVSIQQ